MVMVIYFTFRQLRTRKDGAVNSMQHPGDLCRRVESLLMALAHLTQSDKMCGIPPSLLPLCYTKGVRAAPLLVALDVGG
jgi:hypothetical protein